MPNVVSITVRSINDTAAGFDQAGEGFAKVMGGMKSLAATVGPGIAGPLVAAAGASVAAFASVGVAVGAFGAAVMPQMQKVTEATELYTKAQESAASGASSAAADMEAYNAAMSKLPPATRDTAKAFIGLKEDFTKWSDALAPKTMPIFTKGLEAMRSALPALTPLVETAADALGDMMDSIKKGVSGGGFKSFMGDMNEAAKKTLPDFLGSLKNIGSGFAGILQAFLPFAGSMTGGLEKITKKFAEFGQGLKGSSGFQSFMDGVKDKVPAILDMFRNLAETAMKVIEALAPFSGIGLGVASALAAIVNAIPQGAMDFIAPTIMAIVVATKLWAIAQGIMNVVLAANPIGLVVMAIVAIGVALVVAYQKSQTFRVMVAAAFEGVARVVLFSAKIILQGLKFITGAFLDLVGTMLNGAATAFGWMPGIGPKLKAAAKGFDSIKEGADKAFDGAIKKVKEWDDSVKGMTTRVVIKGQIADAEKKIAKITKDLETVPKEKRTAMLMNLDDMNRKLFQAKVALQKSPGQKITFLKGQGADLTAKLKRAEREIKSLPPEKRVKALANIENLRSGVRTVHSLLNGIQNKTVNIHTYYTSSGSRVPAKDIPYGTGRAHGGIIGAAGGGPRSGMTWVGEQGPELVSLAPGSTVHTAGDSQRMMSGGGGGGPIIVNVSIGGNKVGELLIDPLRKSISARGGNVQATLGR